jgi:hypothetical protein
MTMLFVFVGAALAVALVLGFIAFFTERKHRGAAGPVRPRVWSDPEGPRSAEASSATAAPTRTYSGYPPVVVAERSSGGDAFLGSLAGSFIGSSIADACSSSSSSCDSSFGGCD